MPSGWLKLSTLAQNAGLCLIYVGVAKLVLQLDPVSGIAALVWPPSGIALAAVLLLGFRVLPALFVGELVVSSRPGTPVLVVLAVAFGNALDVAMCAHAFRRLTDYRGSFEGLRHVVGLIAPAVFTTLVGATISVASLTLGGVLPADVFWRTWRAWWIGNLLGVVIVVPFILSWVSVLGRCSVRQLVIKPMRLLEAVLLVTALVGASVAVFFRTGVAYPLENPYVFFPLFVWAAHRFELAGAVTATTIVSGFACWGTTRGVGPFADDTLAGSLLALQTFLGCASLTPLVVAGAISDRACAVRIRDDFLAVAGHELRTPLAAMLLQIEGLQRSMKRDSSIAFAERLGKVANGGHRLERLVDQLLDVSRITSGRLSLEPEPVDLATLVRDVVARLADASDKANSPIAVTGAVRVRGCWDRQRIDQVVTNLLGNAMKYGRGRPVEVELQVDGDAVLRITDHGIGIDEDCQKRIFQKFERAAAAREFGGFGLGLWISRQIVEASGGKIEVQSELGHGASFTVRLPAAPRARLTEVHHGSH